MPDKATIKSSSPEVPVRHDAGGREAVGLPEEAQQEEEDEEDEGEARGVEEHFGLVQEGQR